MATQRVSRAFKDISFSFEAHPVGDLLFSFVDFGTSTQIAEEIRLVINQYEPRVDNVKVNVRPAPDRNEFECVVAYNIVGLDIPAQEFSFVLEATR